MRFPVLHRLLVVLALVALASPAAAAKKPKNDPKAAGGNAPGAPAPGGGAGDKPFAEWSKLIKDADKVPGFFTLWKKRDNLYLELAKEQLDQPFLYIVS